MALYFRNKWSAGTNRTNAGSFNGTSVDSLHVTSKLEIGNSIHIIKEPTLKVMVIVYGQMMVIY